MPSKRYRVEQIIAKLREAEKLQGQGLRIPATCCGTTYPYRLTQIGYVNTTCSGGSCNTGFAYNSGHGTCDASVKGVAVATNTVVTDANGHQTTHCVDSQGHVVQAIDAVSAAV